MWEAPDRYQIAAPVAPFCRQKRRAGEGQPAVSSPQQCRSARGGSRSQCGDRSGNPVRHLCRTGRRSINVASQFSLCTEPDALYRTRPPKALFAVNSIKIKCLPSLTGLILVDSVSMLSGSLSRFLTSASSPLWLPSQGLRQWKPLRLFSCASAERSGFGSLGKVKPIKK